MDRFDFYNQVIETKKIRAVMTIKRFTLVKNLEQCFRFKWNRPQRKFPHKCLVIYRFKKSGSQFSMHFHSSTNHSVALGILRLPELTIIICVNLRNLRFHGFHPTAPSSDISSRAFASTANSIGSSLNTSLQKPSTISATASSSASPRDWQ